jgi:hypothetical protein
MTLVAIPWEKFVTGSRIQVQSITRERLALALSVGGGIGPVVVFYDVDIEPDE